MIAEARVPAPKGQKGVRFVEFLTDCDPGDETPQRCCTGVHGSHTLECAENTWDRILCWCCLATFPSPWACAWSDRGARCLTCADGCPSPCRAHVGLKLEEQQLWGV